MKNEFCSGLIAGEGIIGILLAVFAARMASNSLTRCSAESGIFPLTYRNILRIPSLYGIFG